MNLFLKSATIVDPSNKALHFKKRDLLIEGGKFSKIGQGIRKPKGVTEIELKNLHISQGWFDSSVSFGEPGYEERETIENGLKTAAASGFTDVAVNPGTLPVPDSSADISFLKQAAAGQLTSLHPIGSLTVKSNGTDLAELFDMKNAGAVGFYDYKSPLANANLLKIALLYTRTFNGLVLSFPLEKAIAGAGMVNEGAIATKLGLKGIPALAEELQIARDLYITGYTGGRLHIPTISTAQSVRLIAEAKKKGIDVSCSVAIHNILKTDDLLEDFESDYKVLPPLRTAADNKALVKGLEKGIIDFVTTDHSPLNIEEKRVEFDNAGYGTLGLENAFGSLNSLFDLEKTISLLTKGRQRFGIAEAEIQEGARANLTLFDPDKSYVLDESHILSTSKNSLFLGDRLKGQVYGTINNGQAQINEMRSR